MQRNRSSMRGVLPGLCALVLFAVPGSLVAQESTVAQGGGGPTASAGPAAPPSSTVSPAAPQISRSYTVKLSVDGNLAGRMSLLNSAGQPAPARATITFLQNGKVIASARSDEWGYFQVKGLTPGVYSVVSDAGAQFGAYTVTIQPYDPDAPQQDMQLNLTLAPAENTGIAGGAGADPAPVSTAPVDTPTMMGGGGGGGAGGGMEGLGALAGLGALGAAAAGGSSGGGGGGGGFVSPFGP